jgi:ribonuclease HII
MIMTSRLRCSEGINSRPLVADDFQMSEQITKALFEYDRTRARDAGARYVCGADEVGYGCWAGPLVVAAVRFDYDRLELATEARLTGMNDGKKMSASLRAALLPVIMEVADTAAVVVTSAAQIDCDGPRLANLRALGGALRAVSVARSLNLVDWHDLQDIDDWGFDDQPQRVEGGDRTSAAIAAASIVAKETRDELMRRLHEKYPGYDFATHKGYGTRGHATAIRTMGCLSAVHRRSFSPKVYAEIGITQAA